MKELLDIFSDTNSGFSRNISKIMKVIYIWPIVVGHVLASSARAIKISGDRLFVGVVDNIVLQEITFMKNDIIEGLKKHNLYVEDIIFKIVNFNCLNVNFQKFVTGEVDTNLVVEFSKIIKDEDIKKNYIEALTAYMKYLHK